MKRESPTPRPQALELTDKLIGFDTVSRNSNLGLIEWVRDYLKRLGVGSRLSYDASRAKANLFATLGGASGVGLALCGHTDVVPVEGQAWDTDPFKAMTRDGRIYGRGSADMKGFLACTLAAVPKFLDAPLQRPVHLAYTYDEEVGCLGAPVLIRDLQAVGIRLGGCIVGEPTGMQVMVGHKGLRVYRCCVRGLEAHSSLAPAGVNAIEYAARLVAQIREVAQQLRESGPRDDSFSVPFATMSTGTIKGGTASNIVPRDCEFRFDLRYLPGTNADEPVERLHRYAAEKLLPEMRRTSAEADIRIEMEEEAPALDTAEDDRMTYLGTRLSGNSRLGRAPFATDGGHFHRAGVPTIVVGPGSIDQAHKPNEYVALEQLAQCERFLDRLRDELCAPAVTGH
ncbi:MAG TPA: acetylornithine deacetylase [Burkholderiales bacterium]